MKPLYAVLIILPAVGLGLLVGILITVPETREDESIETARGETVSELQEALATKEQQLSGFTVRLDALKAELESRNRRIEKLEEVMSRAAAVEAALAPISGTPTKSPIDRIGPRRPRPEALANAPPAADPESIVARERPVSTTPAPLFAEAYGGALSRVDWKMIGTSLNELTRLTPRVIRFLNRGRPPSVDLSTSVADVKRKVMLQVLRLGQDVPGTGVNGKFTDPACAANAILVTLFAADLPLSPEQTAKIEEIATRTMQEDAKRRSSYGDGAYELAKLLDEVELKARFFGECFEVLTVPQAKVLSPELSRGRLLVDPFSEAAVFGDWVRVHTFKNANSLAADVHDAVRRLLGGDGALISQSRETVLRWAEGLPKEEILAEQDTLDRSGMITAKRALTWGRLVLDLLKSLVEDLHMTEERAQSIRELTTLSVPVR